MITAILLNWQRTENLREICARLDGEERVGEIIVWNNNPQLHLALDAAKARVVNCSEDFGLFTRFAAASLARHACILYHDDDLIASTETLEQLYRHWRRQPKSCHTLFGRNASRKGEYTRDRLFGPVEIVMTRYTMAHREACVLALSKIPQFADLPGVPVGNGEDIILSHAALAYSGRLNRAWHLPHTELGQDARISIHKRYPEHDAHRTRIIRRCREIFSVRRVVLYSRTYRQWLRVKRALRRRLPRRTAQT